MIITSLFLVSQAEAGGTGSSGGTGGTSNNGQVGGWKAIASDSTIVNGSTQAYKDFYKKANAGSSLNNVGGKLETILASNKYVKGYGVKPGSSLLEDCKKSRYIWYYAKDNQGLSTWIGKNVHPSLDKMPLEASGSYTVLEKVWTQAGRDGLLGPGGIVIICSWAWETPEPVKEDLILTANSGKFLYDGSPKTVTGHSTRGVRTDKGHREVSALARSTRTDVGTQKVPFAVKAKVVDSAGKDVTKEYNVRYVYGDLTITDEKPPGDPETCKPTGSHTVKTFGKNTLTASGDFVGGANQSSRFNNAYTAKDGRPREGATRSSWLAWAAGWVPIGKNDLKTNTVDISQAADSIRKFGGVITSTSDYEYYSLTASFCQPQKRDAKIDEDGNVSWGPWYDVGPEIVASSPEGSFTGEKEYFTYQILGVNCNAEGVRALMASGKLNGATAISGGPMDRDGSVLIQTKTVGLTTSPYNHGLTKLGIGESCKTAFGQACTDVAISGNDSINNKPNDSINNKPESPKFLEQEPKDGEGKPDTDGLLKFFRDNKGRTVRANLWYVDLNTENFNSQTGKKAENSTFNLFEGTPEIAITDFIPNGGSKIAALNSEQTLRGEVTSFIAKSQWASDDGHPYKLGINWAYDTIATNHGPTDITGGPVGKTGVEAKPNVFEAYCIFENEGGRYAAEIPENPFHDKKPLKINWKKESSAKVLFNRAVSDKSQ